MPDKELLFTAWGPLIVTIRGDNWKFAPQNRPSLLNHVPTECAVYAHSWPVNSNKDTAVFVKKTSKGKITGYPIYPANTNAKI